MRVHGIHAAQRAGTVELEHLAAAGDAPSLTASSAADRMAPLARTALLVGVGVAGASYLAPAGPSRPLRAPPSCGAQNIVCAAALDASWRLPAVLEAKAAHNPLADLSQDHQWMLYRSTRYLREHEELIQRALDELLVLAQVAGRAVEHPLVVLAQVGQRVVRRLRLQDRGEPPAGIQGGSADDILGAATRRRAQGPRRPGGREVGGAGDADADEERRAREGGHPVGG